MENIIRRAIEGGYKKIKNPFEVSGQYSDWVKFHNGSLMVQNKIYEYLFDPLFWQALGKACGWGVLVCMNCRVAGWSKEKECGNCNKGGIGIKTDDWKTVALRFHEINLTEGWEKAVEYLISLINEE